MFVGRSLFFTLNIQIAISCSRLLKRLVKRARKSSSLYGELQSQNTALKPLSFTRSSFLLSELLQKCQTRPQYVKYDNMAALYIQSFALIDISLRNLIGNLIRTPTRMLAFLQAADICSVNIKFLSITTPSNLRSSVDFILTESISMSSCGVSFDMTIA